MTEADSPLIPTHNEMWPTLEVFRQLSGSARIDEILEGVVERGGFTEELGAIPSINQAKLKRCWASGEFSAGC